MDKELYKQLKEIEDKLYVLADANDKIFYDELGDIWAKLYNYLEKEKPDDL